MRELLPKPHKSRGGVGAGRVRPATRRPVARQSRLPATPGTYVLLAQAAHRRRIGIGALGTLQLERGVYAYVGSARGPGGLAARIAHHRRRAPAPHWHIDYLRRHTALREVWAAVGSAAWEHRWAQAIERSPAASLPLARFGASDCSCRAHLFHFDRLPSVSAFRSWLAAPPAAADLELFPEEFRIFRFL